MGFCCASSEEECVVGGGQGLLDVGLAIPLVLLGLGLG